MFFDWFRSSPQSLKRKAEKALSQEDFFRAMQLYQEALLLSKEEPQSLQDELSDKLSESRSCFVALRLQQARRALEQESFEEAYSLAEIAAQHAIEPSQQSEAQTILDEVLAWNQQEAEAEPDLDEEEKITVFEAITARAPTALRRDYLRVKKELYAVLFPDKELASFKEAERSNEPAVRYELALLRMEQGDLDAAIPLLEGLSSLLKGEPTFHRPLALCYLSKTHAEELDPYQPISVLTAAQKSFLERAIEHAISSLEGSPVDAALYGALAKMRLLQNDPGLAHRAVDAGLRRVLDPSQRAELLLCASHAFLLEGKDEEAFTQLQEASQVWVVSRNETTKDPLSNKALPWSYQATSDLLRFAYVRKKHIEEALELAESRYLQVENEERCLLLFYMGQLLLHQDHKEEAKEKLEAARALIGPTKYLQEEIEEALSLITGVSASPYRR